MSLDCSVTHEPGPYLHGDQQAIPMRWHVLFLICVVVASLAGFLWKPFNIDDPMYIWSARQISREPLNFYGLRVNWEGNLVPMYVVNKNPPLGSYYLAGVARVLGWSELGLHLGMLLPVLLAILGTYALGVCLCGRPLIAALATWVMPVTLVSSTTVMPDMLMLCLWCWTCVFWIQGLRRERYSWLAVSGVLMGLAALTKYQGVSLIPLLFAYSFIDQKRIGVWSVCFLIPVMILTAYQCFMLAHYDWNPFLDVSRYAVKFREGLSFGFSGSVLRGLFFMGGCMLSALFFTLFIGSKRTLVLAAACMLAVMPLASKLLKVGTTFAAEFQKAYGPEYLLNSGRQWSLLVHMSVFTLAAMSILVMVVTDLHRRRDSTSVLLALWVVGTWVFSSFVNWTISGRTLLPAAPAVGILLARAMCFQGMRSRPFGRILIAVPMLAGLAVSLLVAFGDLQLAESARTAAWRIGTKYKNQHGRLFFSGTWGFQYYMEKAGGKRIQMRRTDIAAGDVLVVAVDNAGSFPPQPWESVEVLGSVVIPMPVWAVTHSFAQAAGFYGAGPGGLLPFVVGPITPQKFIVYLATSDFVIKRTTIALPRARSN